ncbi:PEP-CTERM sorting domain-containing protein [Limnoraphis robusta]|jgi:hypothetical protein|uniref:PEP-CTERM sorting domain-containing protein n=1 Tax=Limnoraphis robusta CCNP1315 TaxID=3110306 RepID=A0ABU5TUM4_9CYAN|nr:PEP-CTERM sorting domain-containing protein [Limnoraphis robusta]MEA5518603.1 PEP-CTERM sorting domain-containing protein [Limnoraphis robusta CCNP1315]MEA5548002.1 PEP-CTERM sorting domain-containing protein [Limnoraphis robusta CCNP1324]
MKSVGADCQNNHHQTMKGWLLSAGMAAMTTLVALPTQAITVGQVKTQVFPYVPRDYTVLDVGTGSYVPLNSTGELTLDEFFRLQGDELSSVTSSAQTASNNAFDVSNPTDAFGGISETTTVTGVGSPSFKNVIDIDGSINLDGENKFTINADRGESVVLNIRGDLRLSGFAAIELTGGVKVDNVLINVLGDVSLFGDSSVFGTILAVNNGSNTTINGGRVAGTLIARDISLANASVDGVYFVPEPFTILGTATALGFGVLFKKEYSQKNKKEKTKV